MTLVVLLSKNQGVFNAVMFLLLLFFNWKLGRNPFFFISVLIPQQLRSLYNHRTGFLSDVQPALCLEAFFRSLLLPFSISEQEI